HRADHLLPPAVADERIGDAEHPLLLSRRLRVRPAHAHRRRHGDGETDADGEHADATPSHMPHSFLPLSTTLVVKALLSGPAPEGKRANALIPQPPPPAGPRRACARARRTRGRRDAGTLPRPRPPRSTGRAAARRARRGARRRGP